jgi:hypothetical protein
MNVHWMVQTHMLNLVKKTLSMELQCLCYEIFWGSNFGKKFCYSLNGAKF